MSSIIKLEREVLINSDKIKSIQTLAGIESEQVKYLTSIVTSFEGGGGGGDEDGTGGISQTALDSTLATANAYADSALAAAATAAFAASAAAYDSLGNHSITLTTAKDYSNSVQTFGSGVALDSDGNHAATLNSAKEYTDALDVGINIAAFNEALGSYATTASLGSYATTASLGSYATSTELANYALNTTVLAIATAAANESEAATNYTDSLVGHSTSAPAFDSSGNHTVTLNSAAAAAAAAGGGGGISQGTLDDTLGGYATTTYADAAAEASRLAAVGGSNLYADNLVSGTLTTAGYPFDSLGNHVVTLNSAAAYTDAAAGSSGGTGGTGGGLTEDAVITLISNSTLQSGWENDGVAGTDRYNDFSTSSAHRVSLDPGAYPPPAQANNYVQYGPIPTMVGAGGRFPNGGNVLRGFDALRPTIQDTSFIIVTHKEFSTPSHYFNRAPSEGMYICGPAAEMEGWHQLDGWVLPMDASWKARTRLQNPHYPLDSTYASSLQGQDFGMNNFDPVIHLDHPRQASYPAVGADNPDTAGYSSGDGGFLNKWPITLNREGFYRVTINIAFHTDSTADNTAYTALAFQLLAVPQSDRNSDPANKRAVGPVGFTTAVRNFRSDSGVVSMPQIGHGSLSFIYKTPGQHPQSTGGSGGAVENFEPLLLGVMCSRAHAEGGWAGAAASPDQPGQDGGGYARQVPHVTFIDPMFHKPLGTGYTLSTDSHPSTGNTIQVEFIHGVGPDDGAHSI